MSINEIFFELIRVSLGTQDSLSRPPSREEWAELYSMSKKQSLVGICFAGLQKLYNKDNPEPSTHNPLPDSTQNQAPLTQNLDEVQYLTWMGMAAKIQQRNEVVNWQCVEVQTKLVESGINSAILKGQGVASVYSEQLRGFRQSGDIDVLYLSDFDTLVEWIRTYKIKIKSVSFHHFDAELFKDTDVELHFSVGHLINRFADWEYHKFIQAESRALVSHEFSKDLSVKTPSAIFNSIYLLAHMQRHYFSEGVGMRHMMDYYYVLKGANLSKDDEARIVTLLKSFRLYDFASAVIWVIKHVTMDGEFCSFMQTDSQKGQFLLNDIMMGGNFGHYRAKKHRDLKDSHVVRFVKSMKHGMRFARHFPNETLWYPIDYIRMFIDNYLMRRRCRNLN